MGAMRLGFMATFMSDPFISGFTTGAAVHVFSSQIKHLFGVTVHNYYGPLSLVHVSKCPLVYSTPVDHWQQLIPTLN